MGASVVSAFPGSVVLAFEAAQMFQVCETF
jgi:hypothetical protein